MKRVPISVALVWSLFAISWFLPVIRSGHSLQDGVLPGWEAFRLALGVANPKWEWQQVISTLTALSNGLVLVSVFVLLRSPHARPSGWLTWSFLSATILDSTWVWLLDGVNDLRAGYWLWLASFAVMTLVLFALRRRPRGAAAAVGGRQG